MPMYKQAGLPDRDQRERVTLLIHHDTMTAARKRAKENSASISLLVDRAIQDALSKSIYASNRPK